MQHTLRLFSAMGALLFCLLVATVPRAGAQVLQNPRPDYYTVPLQRLLANSTGHYIFGVSQGQVDLDSAVRLAATMFQLDPLLPYDETFAGIVPATADAHVRAGRAPAAAAMLPSLQGEEKYATLACLSTYYLHKAGAAPADLTLAEDFAQQLHTLANGAGIEKWKMESLTLLGKINFQRAQLAESQSYFAEAVQLAKTAGNDLAWAKAVANQGTHLPFGAPGRLAMLEQARARFDTLGELAHAYPVTATIVSEYFRTNHVLAKKYLRRCLEIQKSLGYRHVQTTHNVLAYIYLMQHEFEQGFFHADESLKSMHETGDVVMAPFFYSRKAEFYAGLENFNEALSWTNRALDTELTAATRLFWYKSFLQKAQFLSVLKREREALNLIEEVNARVAPETIFNKMHLAVTTGYCYARLRDNERAKQQYEIFNAIAAHFPDEHLHSEFPEALTNIALFYFRIGDAATAKKFIDRTLAYSAAKRTMRNNAFTYLVLFKLDSAQGRHASANEHYKLYKQAHDSAVNVSQRKKLVEMNMKYQSAQKDKDIAMLQEKNTRAALLRNITFAGVALLLVIVGLLFYLYRDKKRSNAQLLEQKMEISTKNQALEQLVSEKEWLLKEIHHRVKNNLQMVMSLLGSQAAYLDKDALAAIQDSQHRMYSMSLIHQKLYTSENVTTIHMPVYLHELTRYLSDCFNTGTRVIVKLAIDPIELDVTQAIPLGLIVNEVMTNAMKHGFPGSMSGTIELMMRKIDEDIIFTLADDGVGIPVAREGQPLQSTFGLKLIAGLMEELGGTFSIANSNGTRVSLRFTRDRIVHAKDKLQEA